jgi:uncharacterized protein YraI
MWWYPADSPRCQATPADHAGRVHRPTSSASSSRRLSVWSMCCAVLLSVMFSAAAAQAAALSVGANATPTTSLTLRAAPGMEYAVHRGSPAGARVSVNNRPFHTDWYQMSYSGQRAYVQGADLTHSALQGGGSTTRTATTATIDLSKYPTRYEANDGYVYTGQRAQVLHHLHARYATRVTTYAGHAECATCSADLWTPGAVAAQDNTDMKSMNKLANYIRTNAAPLGIKYVMWNNRYSTGGAWRQMNSQGNITAKHKDHVHITFLDSFK